MSFTISVARFAPIVSYLNAIRRADCPKLSEWGDVRFFTFDGAWRFECPLPGFYVRYRLAPSSTESQSFVLGLADLANAVRGAKGDLTFTIGAEAITITRSDCASFRYSLSTEWDGASRDKPGTSPAFVMRSFGRAWREMWRGINLYRMRKPDYRITAYDKLSDICILGNHIYASDAKRVIRYQAYHLSAPIENPIVISGKACALAAEIADSDDEITFYHGENRTIIEGADFYIDADSFDHQWPDLRFAFNGESRPIVAQVFAPKNAIRSLRAIGAHTAKNGVTVTANPESGCLIAEVGEASAIVNGITVDAGKARKTTLLDGKFLLDGLAAMGAVPGVIRFPEDALLPNGEVGIGAAIAFEDSREEWAARVMPMRRRTPAED